jgi:hypothetical protein
MQKSGRKLRSYNKSLPLKDYKIGRLEQYLKFLGKGISLAGMDVRTYCMKRKHLKVHPLKRPRILNYAIDYFCSSVSVTEWVPPFGAYF